MTTTNALALATIGRDEWAIMREQAELLVKTGFLPKAVDTPEKALAIMLKGRELHVPAMHALSTITVIQGKPAVSPELMAALVERDYGANALIVEDTTNARCVVSCWKPGWDKRRVVSFTMDEARQAKLHEKNPTWNTYPEAMLRSRAISKACKTHFQASIGGMYTPEEMGAAVTVVDGEVRLSDVPHAEPQPEPTPAPASSAAEAFVDADGVIVERASDDPVEGFEPDDDARIGSYVEWLESAGTRDELERASEQIKADGLSKNREVVTAFRAAAERITRATEATEAALA